MLLVKHKELVVPGTVLADKDYRPSEGAHMQNLRVIASTMGFVNIYKNEIRVVGFEGVYEPTVGDVIIGIVEDIGNNCWFIDTNSPYSALLSASDVKKDQEYVENLKDILAPGEIIVTKIISKDYNKQIKVTTNEEDLGKADGYLIHISPKKVARVIGKRGSMIFNLKTYTGSNYIVGKNGRILIQGGNIPKSVSMLKFIERWAHTSGLTTRVKTMLMEDVKVGT